VVVPFETPALSRLLIRAAQLEGIPVVSISDGFRGDDHSRDSVLADIACALTDAAAERYMRPRRPGRSVTVTGDPRSDAVRAAPVSHRPPWPPRRILVGSYAFDSGDVNCRRGDPERFLAMILAGIDASTVRPTRVVVKHHPADRVDYRTAVDAYRALDVELRTTGDVSQMFGDADVYITTHSTSILDALAAGLEVLYVRVNDQVIHPPFSSDDAVMASRTAASSDQLAALLSAPTPPPLPAGSAMGQWRAEFLGPRDGRCTERLYEAVMGVFRGGEPTAAPAMHMGG
jgi:hypothetical protein